MIRARVNLADLALFDIDAAIVARTDACGGCHRPLTRGRMEYGEVECAGCGTRLRIAQANQPPVPVLFPVMLVNDEIVALIENTPPSRQP